MPSPILTRYRQLEVFAVEDRTAQIVWRDLPEGEISFIVGGQRFRAVSDGGPGTINLDGLAPNLRQSVEVCLGSHQWHLRFRTLPAPTSSVLARIATISDLHLGEKDFGLLFRRGENVEAAERHPIRCARSAVREALDWGAQAIMIKGDITHHGLSTEWELAEKLLAEIDVPVLLSPGNHDTFEKPGSLNALHALREIGHPIDGVSTLDVGEVRLVLGDTTVPTHSWGQLEQIHDSVIDSAGTWGGPVFVGLHHHIHQLPVPWFWPLGIPKGAGAALMAGLARANPRVFVSSGHTHRNRRHGRGPLPYTEVSSTKDYPGVWAGYEITQSSIRQVVRRTAAPDVLPWTDSTRNAVAGVWGMWSPGALSHRSFVHSWA
jgi:hypothetical protein